MQQDPGKEVASRVTRNTDVSGVLHVDGIDQEQVERSTQHVRAVANASTHGPLTVDATYDERAARLTLSIRGSLSAVLRLFSNKSADGERLFEDGTESSIALDIDGVGKVKAVAITDHLLNAAKNHPQSDRPLDMRTEHDDPRQRLHLSLTGSLFATSYLLFVVNLHLTQSRT